MRSKKVVLVESPAKAKTIQKFVDGNTIVRATYGHVRDLPKSTLGVDTEHNFEPKYIIPKKASPVVKELKTLVKGADSIYLATDPDREGEAIAWHIAQALDLDKDKIHRAVFHEITNKAVSHALDHPGTINLDLVDAQQARRVLDRLVGYNLSPLLWQKLYRGLSAGRVQSVALRLIVEREEEIGKFKSQEYWSLWATFITNKKASFLAKLEKVGGKALPKYPPKDMIEKAQEFGPKDDWQVVDHTSEKKQRHPRPPFTTSTLQQDAGHKLHFSVKQTMMHAQKLYEGVEIQGQTVGLITYMRTDSLNLATEAVNEARETIGKLYGANYVPKQPKFYKTKAKNAQEAHEAIRPTSFARTPESVKKFLSPQEHKLYTLIWERAMACQMASAEVEVTELTMAPAKKHEAVNYVARGMQILSPGFLKVYNDTLEDAPSEDGAATTPDGQILPPLAKNDAVHMDKLEPKQHFTQPPPRYTEASLVKEMEKLGIGRPSTYAPTIATIQERGYVQKVERNFVPQEVGKIVIDLLKDKFPSIVDYQFTAQMEENLDDIADGGKKWQKVVGEFFKPFDKLVQAAEKDVDKKKIGEEETDEKCPECGKPLVIKMGRYGRFYACTGFPECRHTRPIETTEKAESQLIEGRKCPNDGGDLVIKASRFGTFIGCSNYPNCKYMESINKEIGVKCPKDGGEVIERRTKRGRIFYGCANYPKCKFASWDKPIADPCPKCKGLLVEKKNQIACTNCDYKAERKVESPQPATVAS